MKTAGGDASQLKTLSLREEKALSHTGGMKDMQTSEGAAAAAPPAPPSPNKPLKYQGGLALDSEARGPGLGSILLCPLSLGGSSRVGS